MDEAILQTFTLFGLGLILGLEHALEVDHVAAVSTLVSQSKSIKQSTILGMVWGLGHTLTLFLVGSVVLIFKLSIPGKLSLLFEFGVGIFLVILGGDLLRKIVQNRIHLHAHTHDDVAHVHIHSHKESTHHNHIHRSLALGMIHGLAGSGVLVLLVLTTVSSVWQGMIFMLIFGGGSIAGMVIASAAIAVPFKYFGQFDSVNQALKAVAGSISIFVGFWIMYSVGYSQHLFF